MAKAEIVTGKSVEDILNMPLHEVNKLTDIELKALTGRLVSAGNKRLRRYEAKTGELPNAGKSGDYSNVKFSVAGKDRMQTLEEFKRAKSFMKAQTSSLRGTRAVKKESQRELKDNFNITVSDDDYDLYWKAYSRLKELHPEVDERNYKYIVLAHMDKMIAQRREKGKTYKSYKTFARAIEKKLTDIYQTNKEIENSVATSGFYPTKYQ